VRKSSRHSHRWRHLHHLLQQVSQSRMLRLPTLSFLEALASRGGYGNLQAFNQEEAALILAIPRSVRLTCPSARAASAVVRWRQVAQNPEQVPCSLCSELTTDFCGSCHFRNAPANPAPFAVCRICDDENRVCRLCTGAGWTREVSEREFLRLFPRSALGQAMVIYGVRSPEGFRRFEAPRESELPQGAARIDGR
jgi:hypothetical protein